MNCNGVFTISGSNYDEYYQDFINMYKITDTDEDTFYESSLINDLLTITQERTTISYNHQNYRDYFAAEFLKQIITKSNILQANEFFGGQQIPQEVLVILSELIAEYNYIENGNNSFIQKFFNNYLDKRTRKPRLTPELCPAAISVLIKVAAIGRNYDLSSFDFSCLNLTSTCLNSIKLSRGKERIAQFEGSVLSKGTLNATGHAGAVQMILYIEPYLLTLSKRGFFAFDTRERVQYQIADYTEEAILAAILLKEKCEIVTDDKSGRLVRWHYTTENHRIKLTQLSELDMNQNTDSDFRK